MAIRSVRTAATSEGGHTAHVAMSLSGRNADAASHACALMLQDTQSVEAQRADSEPLERCAAPHHPAESHNPCPQV